MKTFSLSELLILKATYCCFLFVPEILQSSHGDLYTYRLLILVVDIYLNPLHNFLFFNNYSGFLLSAPFPSAIALAKHCLC